MSDRPEETLARGRDQHLRRVLGFWSLFAVALGGIIGSGWLFGVLRAASVAGPASILSWVLGAAFALILAVSWWRVGASLPRSGGSARYVSYSHGPLAGFLTGWARMVTVGTIPAIEAEAVVTALEAFLRAEHLPYSVTTTSVFEGTPVTTLNAEGTALAAVLLVLLFFVNFRGVRAMGRFNNAASIWKVVVPSGTILGLLVLLQPANLGLSGTSSVSSFAPFGLPSVFLATSTSGVLFAYLGFAQAVDFSGEARDPRRDLSRAILAGLAVSATIYVLLEVAFVGALNWAGAGVAVGDWHGLSGSAWGSLPLYYAVTEGGGVGFVLLGIVLLSDAWVSPTGTGSIYLGSSSRALFGLSVDGFFPAALRRISRGSRVPWVALLASLSFSLVFLLPLPSWYQLVALISSALVLSYLTAPVALPSLARALPERFPWSGRSSSIAAVAGFEVVSLALFWSGFQVVTWLVVVMLAGLWLFVVYYAATRLRLRRPVTASLSLALLGLIVSAAILGPLGGSLGAPFWASGSLVVVVAYFALLMGGTGALTAALWRACAREDRATIVAGAWLLPWVLATYLLTYAGTYGPAGSFPGARALVFPWDSVLAATLGAGFYFWARRTARAPEEVRAVLAPDGARDGVAESTARD